MRSRLTIGIAGAGGDGVVVLGSLLQRLTASQGYFSQMPRYYGPQIRGGCTAVKLELNAGSLRISKDSLDILVCLNWDKYLEVEEELPINKDTLVLYENNPSNGIDLPQQSYQVNFSKISREVTDTTRNKNLVVLGLLKRILDLPEDLIQKAVREDKELFLLRGNNSVINAGEHLFSNYSFPDFRLSRADDQSPKVVFHGNSVIAQAAIRAGCKAFFGYPITPAAEIMQEMQEELSEGRDTFLQAEDEIASSGLIIGASLVGVKSMTSTSGPGFDLMTEMMGLASSAEIPMVIINVQRCGPSTGIPSKSEQSDLNHAIYGGHGDAPRVVLAPYDIKRCYCLAIESINIAQYFQTVTILLSDQWLGQTFVAIDDGFMKKDYPIWEIKKPTKKDIGHYHRYRIGENFISPMSVTGDEGLIYQTTGLTYNEDGAPTLDFKTHQSLHEKRWRKLTPLRQRDDLVSVFGQDESSKGIITWGSSAQFVLETIRELELQDKIKVCVPELIYPLPDRVKTFLKSTDKLLVIEMNYSGQLYHYLRSEVDLPEKTRLYSRAGGRTFSIKELAKPVIEVAR